MVKIKFIFISFFLISLFSYNAVSQESEKKSKVVVNNYDRNSLTVIVLENEGCAYKNDLIKAMAKIEFPVKFDNNLIDVISVKAPFARREGNVASPALSMAFNSNGSKRDIERTEKLKNLLIEQKISNKIIAKWFSKTPDNKFSMDLIEKRGDYNATDADFNNAKDSKRGLEDLKNQGYGLINNSYILILDFGNILTMDEYYNFQDEKRKALKLEPQQRTRNGYKTDLKSFLFKIDFNAEVEDKLFTAVETIQEFPWIGQDKNNVFNDIKMPVEGVINIFYPLLDGSQLNTGKKSKEQLFEKMVSDGFNTAIFLITKKHEAFKLKSPIKNGTKGIFFPYVTSKIGTKEGLFTDQRFFALEKTVKSNGEMKSKIRGVVRVSNKISDNSKVTEGETVPSKLYQESGRKLDEGLLLQEKLDWGIEISGGIGIPMSTTSSYNGVYNFSNTSYTVTHGPAVLGRLSYNITPLFKKIKFPTKMKLFVELRSVGEQEQGTMTSLQSAPSLDAASVIYGGISKDFHIIKNVQIAPFVMYSLYGASEESSPVEGHLAYGAKMPINITYYLDIVPGVTMLSIPTGEYRFSSMYIDASLRFKF